VNRRTAIVFLNIVLLSIVLPEHRPPRLHEVKSLRRDATGAAEQDIAQKSTQTMPMPATAYEEKLETIGMTYFVVTDGSD